ncbi:Ig-like domain-containing protein [uncultured Shewanella sp.]|uniref:Ig-like domain-containing protein n=1 Tax=uncultured Shewanella sp. TaxID=173975 RepID=UPI00261DB15B|nr:Ig-like domain-containing protein [uncultured Shewanella sp.]
MTASTTTLKAQSDIIIQSITEKELYIQNAQGQFVPLEVGDIIKAGEVFRFEKSAQFVLEIINGDTINQETVNTSSAIQHFDKTIDNGLDNNHQQVLLSDGDTLITTIDRDGNEVLASAGYDTQPGSQTFQQNAIDSHNSLTGQYATTGITINNVTDDNRVNLAESEGYIAVTGSVTGQARVGDNVVISAHINGVDKPLKIVEVDSDFTYLANIDGQVMLNLDSNTFTATVTTYTHEGFYRIATAKHTFDVDLVRPELSIHLDVITSDNVISLEESNSTVTITGFVGGDAKVGDSITVTVNGIEHYTNVTDTFTFAVPVDGGDLAADNRVIATVLSYDAAGNSSDGLPSATTTQDYTVDTTIPEPTIHLDLITPDNVISLEESNSTVTITGFVGGDAKVGDSITVTVNGIEHYTNVTDTFTFSVPVDGGDLAADNHVIATVLSYDVAGNSSDGLPSATTTQDYTVDTTGPNIEIIIDTINEIRGPNEIYDIRVSGQISSDQAFNEHDNVTININGINYTPTIIPLIETQTGQHFIAEWSINISNSELRADSDYTVDAYYSTQDAVGNPANSNAHQTYTINQDVTANDDNTFLQPAASIQTLNEYEFGTLQYLDKNGQWQDMQANTHYQADSHTEIRFVPHPELIIPQTQDVSIGSFDNNLSTTEFDGPVNLSDWGVLSEDRTSVTHYGDGFSIRTSVSKGLLTAYDNDPNTEQTGDGFGIGNESQIGLTEGESIFIEVFDLTIDSASFIIDGAGEFFKDPQLFENNQTPTQIVIRAFDSNDNLIEEQGGYKTSSEWEHAFTFNFDQPVAYFEITTNGVGDYLLQSITLSRTVSEDIILETQHPDGSIHTEIFTQHITNEHADNIIPLTDELLPEIPPPTEGSIWSNQGEIVSFNTNDLLANDKDGDDDPLEIINVSQKSEHGNDVVFDPFSGKITYTPTDGFFGTDTFFYTVSDNQGSYDDATVTINVLQDYAELKVFLDPISSDSFINSEESQAPVSVTGYVDAEFILTGQPVTITIEFSLMDLEVLTLEYQTIIDNHGQFSIENVLDHPELDSREIYQFEHDESLIVTAKIQAIAPNGALKSSTAIEQAFVDIQAPALTVTLDEIGMIQLYDDPTLYETITITASVNSNQPLEPNMQANLSIGDSTYTSLVSSEGQVSFDVDAQLLAHFSEHNVHINLSQTDNVGNTINATDTKGYLVNAQPDAVNDNTTPQPDAFFVNNTVYTFGHLEIVDLSGNTIQVVNGEQYSISDISEINFVPDTLAVESYTRDLQVGVFDGVANITDFGDIDSLSENGLSITKLFSDSAGEEVTVKTTISEGTITPYNDVDLNTGDERSDIGVGIGDGSRRGFEAGDQIKIDIQGGFFNKVAITIDGLGPNFTAPNTAIVITAYDTGGNIIDSQSSYQTNDGVGDINDHVYEFLTSSPIHYFIIESDGGVGDFVLQNFTMSRTAIEEVDLLITQPDGEITTLQEELFFAFDQASETKSLTESIAAATEAPINVPLETASGETLFISFEEILNNDSDPDGDNSHLSLMGISVAPAVGEVLMGPDGIYFTAHNNFIGEAVLTYILADEQGGRDEAQITINTTGAVPESIEVSAPIVSIVTDLNNNELLVQSELNNSDQVEISILLQDNILDSGTLLINIEHNNQFTQLTAQAEGNILTVYNAFGMEVPGFIYTNNNQITWNETLSLTFDNPITITSALLVNGQMSPLSTDTASFTTAPELSLTIEPLEVVQIYDNPDDYGTIIISATVESDQDIPQNAQAELTLNGQTYLAMITSTGFMQFAVHAAELVNEQSQNFSISTTLASDVGHSTTVAQTSNIILNNAPIASNDTANLAASKSIFLDFASLLGNDVDPEGQLLTVINASSDNPSLSIVMAKDGIFIIARHDFTAQADVTYTIADNLGRTDTGTITIFEDGTTGDDQMIGPDLSIVTDANDDKFIDNNELLNNGNAENNQVVIWMRADPTFLQNGQISVNVNINGAIKHYYFTQKVGEALSITDEWGHPVEGVEFNQNALIISWAETIAPNLESSVTVTAATMTNGYVSELSFDSAIISYENAPQQESPFDTMTNLQEQVSVLSASLNQFKTELSELNAERTSDKANNESLINEIQLVKQERQTELETSIENFNNPQGNVLLLNIANLRKEITQLEETIITISDNEIAAQETFNTASNNLTIAIQDITFNIQTINNTINQLELELTHNVDSHIIGTDGDDTLVSPMDHVVIEGKGGNDALSGQDGNDILIGGEGNDILIGGLGNNILTGENGADTFVFLEASESIDHITDFNLHEDSIDISHLLQQEHLDKLEQQLHIYLDTEGNTTLSFDSTHDGHFNQNIVLDGIDLFAQYGVTTNDENAVINGLLGDGHSGALIVDTTASQHAAPPAGEVPPEETPPPTI